MWMRLSWDSQYTRTETERATTPYYYYLRIYTILNLYYRFKIVLLCRQL